MRSLFGDQSAEVSLGVKTETNQESLLREKRGGLYPSTGAVVVVLGEFNTFNTVLQYPCTKQLGQNLTGSVLLSVIYLPFLKKKKKMSLLQR